LRADLLRRLGWGLGLTEDYAFRQQLLLQGVKIVYEPTAIGCGEAPLTWEAARNQRARWLRGTHDASRKYRRPLLIEGVRRRDASLLDGALQASFPSYSTLSIVSLVACLVHVGAGVLRASESGDDGNKVRYLVSSWTLMAGALLAYPHLGLVLERAPRWAYAAVLLGPWFVVWRTWLAVTARLSQRPVVWVRTPRKAERASE
jgi:hypothetical protein